MGYTKCGYRDCNKTSHETSMFRFPVNEQGRLLLWIRNSGNSYLESLTNKELGQRFICAAHFTPDSIQHGTCRPRLIGPAIPVHFEVGQGPSSSAMSNVHVNLETDPPSPEVLKVKTPTKCYLKRPRSASSDRQSTSTSLASSAFPLNSPTQRLSRKCLFEGPKRRKSRKCIFEENVVDTPEKKRIKETASSLLRKNNALKAQLRRLRQKSEKKINEDEQFRNSVSKTLALMQLRKANDKKKWTKDEKNFCLSLYYKSPSTYKFLRRSGVVLAAESTIRLWLSKSSCMPGLCSDVFKMLKKKFENQSIIDRACVLCFDEMSIMTDLEYTKKFDLIEGFEDLGANRRTNKMAKSALVFLVRGLYSGWKFPVAYFLANTNVNGDTLEVAVKSLLNKLFEHGLLPKAVVCDQASTNQKLYKSLGASKDNPFFFCRGKKIFALFDVPHLIKNVRNNLLHNNYLLDEKEISFQDIRKTYDLDKKSKKSRALSKITERHINPNSFQKMTVSLATQIFSNSVAKTIKTAKNTGELQSETAENTYKFIQVVNNMFDALNSRNKFSKNPHRHALSKTSTLVRNSIEKGKDTFEKLQKICLKSYKSGDQKRILTRPPCFDGVVQSCQAVLQLFQEESTQPNISYLITTKLNQDVIENLFARFRQKGGFNRNPSAKLLRHIFRSYLVNNLIKLPSSKNCEDEDDVFIDLNAGQYTSPEQQSSSKILAPGVFIDENKRQNTLKIYQTPVAGPSSSSIGKDTTSTNQYTSPEQQSSSKILAPGVFIDENKRQDTLKIYQTPVAGPSSSSIGKDTTSTNASSSSSKVTLEDCSVSYFAGYLAKSCIQKYKCSLCEQNLIKDVDLDDNRQLLILNKSYSVTQNIKLKMPSDTLVKFVENALACYNELFETLAHCVNVKTNMTKAILDFLSCEAPELLNITCDEHMLYIIDQMIFVKICFYCKSHKNNIDVRKMHPKVRILKHK